MKRFRTIFHCGLALVLSVNLTLTSAWHEHAGHCPALDGDVALELTSHDHSGTSHAGHTHGGHATEGDECHVAEAAPSRTPANLPVANASQATGWSSSGCGDEHPDDCAVCRFFSQSSAPMRGASLECSQAVVSALVPRTTESPASRLQRRQQSRAPPAVS